MFYFGSTQSLNTGEDDYLRYQQWLGALKEKCKSLPHNLDDCLDECDKAGLSGQALKDCYCKCWNEFPPTPRKKRRDQLIEEWKKTHPNDPWPDDPQIPNRRQTPHHIFALGDGGDDDGGTNVEPLPQKDHNDLHKENGDDSRWGRRRGRTCD